MRLEVTIRHLSMRGIPAGSQERLRAALSDAIARELRTALLRDGLPGALRAQGRVARLNAPILSHAPGPGAEARLADGLAARFCAGLGAAPGRDGAARQSAPASRDGDAR
ncbi:MAG: hypothetical protein KDA73_12635 [Rhodobacteraceae bacterium]|nr:hypothetical protein [Paracoccaceae bacterium]